MSGIDYVLLGLAILACVGVPFVACGVIYAVAQRKQGRTFRKPSNLSDVRRDTKELGQVLWGVFAMFIVVAAGVATKVVVQELFRKH